MKTDMLIEYLFVGGSYDGERMRIDHEYGPLILQPQHNSPTEYPINIKSDLIEDERYERFRLMHRGKEIEVFVISNMLAVKDEGFYLKIHEMIRRREGIG